jgi:hypothetical protein
VRGEQQILAFNRGMISRLAMARTDLKRYPMSAEEQTNFVPRVLGSAMLRTGWEYLHATLSNAAAKNIPFVFSATDTALLEMTASSLRVQVDDEIVTRPAVTAAIANGTFDSNLTSWTDADEAGGASAWVTGGYMGLTGNGTAAAIQRQAVTCNEPNTVHALRVVVARGPVTIRVGTAAGLSDYFEVEMGTGTYSLAFTPTGNFSIDLLSRSTYQALVDSIAVEGSGDLVLPAPWGASDLSMMRWDQSGDVVFVACSGHQQRKIERLGATSWGISLYRPTDGPYRAQNTSAVTLTPGALTGDTTLTASAPTFRSSHVGALFTVTSTGQDVTESFTATGNSDSIRVTGVGADRAFTIVLSGLSASGNTVILERSFDDAVWSAVSGKSWTADTTESYNDGLDNQIVYYRLRCSVYAGGTTEARLTIATGSIRGTALVTGFTSSTVVSVAVLNDFGGLTATDTWSEGYWSDYRGWPSAVAFSGGRLWWAGKDRWFGSVTDDFANFDPDYEGEAGPIVRSIGSGPVDVIGWLLDLQRLMAGADGSVVVAKSSSLDEPLTSANFQPKTVLTIGSERVAAAKIDDSGVFVQQGGYRVVSMAPSIESPSNYAADDLTQLVPDIGKPGIVSLCVQRQPDTRVHCVRSDGKVALMVYDKTEDVRCWILVETDGLVEDAVVLPGQDGEDAVYYVVNRTIGGVAKRYIERWAREDECIGGAVSKLADSFVTYNGSNLGHLEGESVVGWYAGVAYDAVTVSGGAAAGMPAGAIVGLAYEARFKSTRLAYLYNPKAGESTGLPSRKRSHSLALVLADTHAQGVQYGKDFDTMDDLPLMEGYEAVDPDSVWAAYNYESFSLPGEWEVDSRLCLKAAAPRPCTLLAAIPGLSANATT